MHHSEGKAKTDQLSMDQNEIAIVLELQDKSLLSKTQGTAPVQQETIKSKKLYTLNTAKTKDTDMPTFQSLYQQSQWRKGIKPNHHRFSAREHKKKPHPSFKIKRSHTGSIRQKGEEENLRDDYFESIHQTGFGNFLQSKGTEFAAQNTVMKIPNMEAEATQCYRIEMDRKMFYRISYNKVRKLLYDFRGGEGKSKRASDEMLILEIKNLNPEQIKEMCNILEVEPVVASECAMIHSVDKLDIFGSRSFIIHASLIEEDDVNLNYFEPIRIFRYGNVLIVFPRKEFSLTYILQVKMRYTEVQPVHEISLQINKGINSLGTIEEDEPSRENSTNTQNQETPRKSTFTNLSRLKSRGNIIQQYFESIVFICLLSVMKLTEPFVELMLREANRVLILARHFGYNEKSQFVFALGLSQSLLSHLLQTLDDKKTMMEQMVQNSQPDKYEKQKLKAYLFSREFGNQMQYILDRFQLQEAILNKIKLQLQLSSNIFHAHVEQGMTQFQNKMNRSMNLFAAIATMFLPLTLISGIFGMNVTVPWQREYNQLWPFWVLIAVMMVIFLLIFFWMKCRKWF